MPDEASIAFPEIVHYVLGKLGFSKYVCVLALYSMLSHDIRTTLIPFKLIQQQQVDYPLPELFHLFRVIALLESDFPNQKNVHSVVTAIHKVVGGVMVALDDFALIRIARADIASK